MEAELENAIAELYRAPLDDFVRRRDALTKELRTGGKRDEASIVKNVRKPSRLAWALNVAAHEHSDTIEALDNALAETLNAHAGDGDVRSAIAGLRAAARDLANHAVRAAADAGFQTESSVLTNSVLAILGSPDSLAQLRRAALTDVPEAGGVDFLASLTMAPVQPVAPTKSKRLTDKREIAERALRDAESSLQMAEARLSEAKAEVLGLREKVERLRREAETIAADRLD